MIKPQKKATRGFTLIEILIVVVLVAILSSLIVPRFLNQGPKARALEAVNVMGAIQRAQMQFLDATNWFYPRIVAGPNYFLCDNASGEPDAARDQLGVDLTQICNAGRWDISIDHDNTVGATSTIFVITANSLDPAAPGTLVLTVTTAAAPVWTGTLDYATGTGRFWPNLD